MPEHGTRYMYTHYRCRCDECREANRAYHVKARADRIARGVPDNVEHGVYGTYTNWGCRCEPCRKANSERCKQYEAETGYNKAWNAALRALRGRHLAEFDALFEAELSRG